MALITQILLYEQASGFFKINPNAPESMVASDTCYAFNEYLQAFVETGLVGFILMLGILVCALEQVKNNIEKDTC